MEAAFEQNRRSACPGNSERQTACLVFDVDKDGVNDIVVGSRKAGSQIVWYRRGRSGGPSTRSIAGSTSKPAELLATSTVTAISISYWVKIYWNKLYWWENPYPHFAPRLAWVGGRSRARARRCTTTRSSATLSVTGTIRSLSGFSGQTRCFWQAPRAIPVRPNPGTFVPIATVGSRRRLAKADIDGDGKIDLIGGGYWFKHQGGTTLIQC